MEAKKNPKQDLQRQSFKFFLIGLSISVTLAITAFEWRTKKSEPVPQTFDPPPEAIFQVKATVPEVIPLPKAPIPIKKNITTLTKPETLITFIETNDPKEEIDDNPIADKIAFFPATDIPVEDVPIIFLNPEVMPEPIGGYKLFYEQLSTSIKYPRQAQRNNTEGKVFVEFLVDENGKITNLKVSKGIGHGCDEEAMRVLSLTHWQPGKQRGIPVKVRMTLPLTFKLN
jgi:periplasmic protein TonB